MPQDGKTDGVVVVTDDLATWLTGLLAGAGREPLTTWVLNSDQEQGCPPAVLAGRLHHDVTQLQGQHIERALPNWRTRCWR
jgi:hypothetical protein